MFRMGESRTAARAVIGRRPLPAMAPLLLPLLCGSSALAAEPDPLVAAIYFGDWHVNPQMSAVHGPNWTEYQLPIHAGPRFPGHLQPNIPVSAAPSHTVQLSLNRHPSDPVLTALPLSLPPPQLEVPGTFGLNASENEPEVMAKKIDVATEHGVGMFLFDWCGNRSRYSCS